MPILQNGQFTFTIESNELARGLRPTKRAPRNSKYLIECEGAVGLDGILSVLPQLEGSRIVDALLAGVTFPYPQVFVFIKVIIVATRSVIYEWDGTNLNLGIDVTGSEGLPWAAVDFFDYIYMSNTHVAVRRKYSDQLWELAPDLPTTSAICNYNSQVLIGSPDVEQ